MDQNIHSHTHVMDEKYVFLLIMSRDNSDKLCWHLVEIEKLSPPPGTPPLKSSILMESLGRETMCAPKRQRDAYSSINK